MGNKSARGENKGKREEEMQVIKKMPQDESRQRAD